MENLLVKIVLGIIGYILGVLLLITVGITAIFGFFIGFAFLHGILVGVSDFFVRNDFIGYILPTFNYFIGLIAFILIIIGIAAVKFVKPIEKQEIYFEEIDSTSNDIRFIEKTVYKIIYFIVPLYVAIWNFVGKNKVKLFWPIFALCLVMGYYSLTTYSIIYQDTIVKHSFLNPTGKTYRWDDIEQVEVRIDKDRYDYDYYYVIKFKDKDTLNVDKSISSHLYFADTFLLIDQKVKELGINKIIDRTDLEKWGTQFDEDYVEKVQRLFID